jgi:hypothetical protein
MGKIAMILLSIVPSLAFGALCKRCAYDSKHKAYPAYSKQLQECIKYTAARIKKKLVDSDYGYINKIIYRENRQGITSIMSSSGCYGLGQGKKATYRATGVPWLTRCPSCQVEMILDYVTYRYKTFKRAWDHHLRRKWY